MKKNELSVWTFPYKKSYYLTHPWKLWHDFYWNIRNFWHRGRYGFAYVDVWDWSEWWPKVGAAALRYLKENGHGYPGIEPWETPEKWDEHLQELADKLDWCADSQDIPFSEEENEYSKAMEEIQNRCRREETDEKGMWHTWLEMTDEDKKIRDKYFEKEKELQEKYDNKRSEIFAELGRNLPRYWD